MNTSASKTVQDTPRGVAVTVLDEHYVALTARGTLILGGQLAQIVSNDHQDSLGVSWGDLADRTQWMRDWEWTGEPSNYELREYLGDAAYLGETWMIYAVLTRANRVARYIGIAVLDAPEEVVL